MKLNIDTAITSPYANINGGKFLMINVPIDRIVPLTDARDNFSKIITDIETQSDGMYVLTKGGKPSIALINISYLASLIGDQNNTTPPTTVSAPKNISDNKPSPRPPVKSFEVASDSSENKLAPAVPSFDAKMPQVGSSNFPQKNSGNTSASQPMRSPNIASKPVIDPSWISDTSSPSASPINPTSSTDGNAPTPISSSQPPFSATDTLPISTKTGPIDSSTGTPSTPTPAIPAPATPPANSSLAPNTPVVNTPSAIPPISSTQIPTSPPAVGTPATTPVSTPTPKPDVAPITRPINPWPILPSREAAPKVVTTSAPAMPTPTPSAPAPLAPTSTPINTSPNPVMTSTSTAPTPIIPEPAVPVTPPAASTPIAPSASSVPIIGTPTTSAPNAPSLPTPVITPTPKPVIPAISIQEDKKPDLPPPPANDVTIPFDSPPKVDSEPGEAPIVPGAIDASSPVAAPETPQASADSTVATNPVSATPAPPAPKPTIKDLDI
jgi:hypothetical protein